MISSKHVAILFGGVKLDQKTRVAYRTQLKLRNDVQPVPIRRPVVARHSGRHRF